MLSANLLEAKLHGKYKDHNRGLQVVPHVSVSGFGVPDLSFIWTYGFQELGLRGFKDSFKLGKQLSFCNQNRKP